MPGFVRVSSVAGCLGCKKGSFAADRFETDIFLYIQNVSIFQQSLLITAGSAFLR